MKLKDLRIKMGLTQQELANALNISRMKYNHYELGDSEPNIDMLIKLADFYHLTIDEIVEHDVPYLINKSHFSPEQLNLIEIIKTCSNEQCNLIEAYAKGLLHGQQQTKIKK
ncbi:MAG: helix-turn-helix transcriptional regulator [Clostridia bacterium]|nr:helix-turn-helix transcriptional regulator [Clostridia bacterium]